MGEERRGTREEGEGVTGAEEDQVEEGRRGKDQMEEELRKGEEQGAAGHPLMMKRLFWGASYELPVEHPES